MTPPEKPGTADKTMKAAILSVGMIAAALAFSALVIFDARSALGVAVGGAIATANLYVFARIGEAFLSDRGAGPWVAVAIVKLVFLFGGVFLLIKSGVVSGIALA